MAALCIFRASSLSGPCSGISLLKQTPPPLPYLGIQPRKQRLQRVRKKAQRHRSLLRIGRQPPLPRQAAQHAAGACFGQAGDA